nr:hypothetical protein CFP56_04322 [Quercus suber]
MRIAGFAGSPIHGPGGVGVCRMISTVGPYKIDFGKLFSTSRVCSQGFAGAQVHGSKVDRCCAEYGGFHIIQIHVLRYSALIDLHPLVLTRADNADIAIPHHIKHFHAFPSDRLRGVFRALAHDRVDALAHSLGARFVPHGSDVPDLARPIMAARHELVAGAGIARQADDGVGVAAQGHGADRRGRCAWIDERDVSRRGAGGEQRDVREMANAEQALRRGPGVDAPTRREIPGLDTVVPGRAVGHGGILLVEADVGDGALVAVEDAQCTTLRHGLAVGELPPFVRAGEEVLRGCGGFGFLGAPYSYGVGPVHARADHLGGRKEPRGLDGTSVAGAGRHHFGGHVPDSELPIVAS